MLMFDYNQSPNGHLVILFMTQLADKSIAAFARSSALPVKSFLKVSSKSTKYDANRLITKKVVKMLTRAIVRNENKSHADFKRTVFKKLLIKI